MEAVILEICKTKDLPKTSEGSWSKHMVERLLTELAIKEHYTGSVYAESEKNIVEFKVSTGRQKALTKSGNNKTVATFDSRQLTRLITYINGEIFQLKKRSMCCGILKVIFADEQHERLFSIFTRRSGALGDFLQIDQFKNHL